MGYIKINTINIKPLSYENNMQQLDVIVEEIKRSLFNIGSAFLK